MLERVMPADATPLRWNVGASSRHRTVAIGGVPLAYDDDGVGPVVVGLHATAHGSRDFEHVRGRLAASHRVLTLDWPGHGRSGGDIAPFTAERCEAVLAEFLDALSIDRAILIGCSIGGAAALRYAASHPHRVRCVVACNPGGLAPTSAIARGFCATMASVARGGQRDAWWFRPAFSAFCRRLLITAPARAQRERIIAQARECAVPMEQAWMSFAQPESDIRPLMATLSTPVLFAWAMSDTIVSLAESRAAAEQVPEHEIVGLRGGHCGFLESPEEFLAAIIRFEAKTASRG